MSITAGTLLEKVSKILLDETNVRWPITTEMIGWLDSAQREAVSLKPSLFSAAVVRQLQAGTKQVLATGVPSLIEVVRNMGAAGTTPGLSIAPILRSTLDRLLPDWHNTTASATVKYFALDPRNPKEYYVYPPQPATGMGYVEEIVAKTPTVIASTSTNISLDDIYENVLINLVLHRAYAKDTDSPGDAERSQKYRAMALESIGMQAAIGTPS